MWGATARLHQWADLLVKRDQLRRFITWSREAYLVAANPPACNYAKGVDVSEKDDIGAYSRMYLLRLSIDVKFIIADLLVKLPKRRAEVLYAWILDESDYAEARLTYRQREGLKRDRRTLANRLHAGLHR